MSEQKGNQQGCVLIPSTATVGMQGATVRLLYTGGQRICCHCYEQSSSGWDTALCAISYVLVYTLRWVTSLFMKTCYYCLFSDLSDLESIFISLSKFFCLYKFSTVASRSFFSSSPPIFPFQKISETQFRTLNAQIIMNKEKW